MRDRHHVRVRTWLTGLAITTLVGCDERVVRPAPRTPSVGETECGSALPFRRQDFTHPTRIDNRWFPLVPGTQYILDGLADRGGGLLPHRVVFTVTDLTKVIDGVRTIVMWDRDYNLGELREAELSFFAQDDHGNVWNLGEYPEEYERGEFLGAPNTWFAGLSGAEAGVHMLGKPRLDYRYLQGWAPDINFLDCAGVFRMSDRVCVPYNCFENVLVTDEASPLDPGSGHQRKYHAPSVGIVQVGAVNDPEGETLVLTNLLFLGPEAMAEVRTETLKLEAQGYRLHDLYRRTEPMQRLP